MKQKIWDKRYIDMAKHISEWSKDPSTKAGVVITKPNNQPVSFGVNGFPKGVEDSEERFNDRDLKYKMAIHAEENAIFFSKADLEGCTIYTYPLQPCSLCASKIIQTGIKRVVSVKSQNDRWKNSFKLAEQLFKEAGVELVLL